MSLDSAEGDGNPQTLYVGLTHDQVCFRKNHSAHCREPMMGGDKTNQRLFGLSVEKKMETPDGGGYLTGAKRTGLQYH